MRAKHVVVLTALINLRRFTPEANRFFRFKPGDIGRPIDDIASNLPMPILMDALNKAGDSPEVLEKDITTEDGETELLVRIVSGSKLSHDTRGTIMTMIDVTELRTYAKELEEARREADQRLAEVEELYAISPVAMALVDSDMRYIRVNERLA